MFSLAIWRISVESMLFIKNSLTSTPRLGKESTSTHIALLIFFFFCSALVGVNLSGNAKLQIDLVAIKSINNVKRETMHVQGISYWAPANIGPYSQSVVVSI